MGVHRQTTTLPKAALDTLIRRIVDDGILGVALVGGPRYVHVSTNAKYERVVVDAPALGRPLRDVLPMISDVFLDGVIEGGRAAVHELELGGSFITFSFARVDSTPSSILVIAEDVTAIVVERERAKLFMALTAELLPSVDPLKAVRSVVTQAERALGARSSSVFVLDGAKTLRGAAGEWDWTRTSFEVALADWPNAAETLASGRARFITKTGASGAEVGWFEARGIAASLCVPLRANGSSVGVLFFDFDDERRLPMASLDFADAIGAHCAAALARWSLLEHGRNRAATSSFVPELPHTQ